MNGLVIKTKIRIFINKNQGNKNLNIVILDHIEQNNFMRMMMDPFIYNNNNPILEYLLKQDHK